jgi:hypothetical protein
VTRRCGQGLACRSPRSPLKPPQSARHVPMSQIPTHRFCRRAKFRISPAVIHGSPRLLVTKFSSLEESPRPQEPAPAFCQRAPVRLLLLDHLDHQTYKRLARATPNEASSHLAPPCLRQRPQMPVPVVDAVSLDVWVLSIRSRAHFHVGVCVAPEGTIGPIECRAGKSGTNTMGCPSYEDVSFSRSDHSAFAPRSPSARAETLPGTLFPGKERCARDRRLAIRPVARALPPEFWSCFTCRKRRAQLSTDSSRVRSGLKC